MTFLPSNKHFLLDSLVQSCVAALMVRYQDVSLCQHYIWWMLEALSKKTRAQLLIMHDTNFLTAHEYRTLQLWIEKQVHEKIPLAYLIGTVPFCDLTLSVEQPVLIPRVETEYWCHELILLLKGRIKKNIHIADIGTGSGCIALSLAHAFPNICVDAIDISEKALELARKNGEKNSITNVRYRLSDLMVGIGREDQYDIIISNPPYIARHVWERLDESVRLWEDPGALIAESDGLAIIEKIIVQAEKHIKKESLPGLPRLIFEIGDEQQASIVGTWLKKRGYTTDVWQDLAGIDRVILGYRDDYEGLVEESLSDARSNHR